MSFFILYLARWLRAKYAASYIHRAQRLLDIGCGDGYFLKRCYCDENYGIDRLLGDEVVDKLHFPSLYFDYVVMLSTLQYLVYPEIIIWEAARVLKPSGILVITTPKQKSRYVKNLYIRHAPDGQIRYFDFEEIKRMSAQYFDIVDYRILFFGFNQVFCLKKSAVLEVG